MPPRFWAKHLESVQILTTLRNWSVTVGYPTWLILHNLFDKGSSIKLIKGVDQCKQPFKRSTRIRSTARDGKKLPTFANIILRKKIKFEHIWSNFMLCSPHFRMFKPWNAPPKSTDWQVANRRFFLVEDNEHLDLVSSWSLALPCLVLNNSPSKNPVFSSWYKSGNQEMWLANEWMSVTNDQGHGVIYIYRL